MQEQVILVNEADEELGFMDKIQAHKEGLLHRAFSVFLFNEKGEMLLQQRAKDKYHSPLLWTNTCCSHPRKGESIISAAKRRLVEEMGLSCEVKVQFSFIYKVKFENGLYEHELDHVLTGSFSGIPAINPEEVASYRWVALADLEKELAVKPEGFTVWFRIIFKEYLENLNSAWK